MSSVLSMIYGISPTPSTDAPDLRRIHEFMITVLNAAKPGKYLVDIFPALDLLPPWLAKFKRDGQAAYERFTESFTRLLKDSKTRKVRI